MNVLLIAPKWPEHSLWGQIYFRFPYLSLNFTETENITASTQVVEGVILDQKSSLRTLEHLEGDQVKVAVR